MLCIQPQGHQELPAARVCYQGHCAGLPAQALQAPDWGCQCLQGSLPTSVGRPEATQLQAALVNGQIKQESDWGRGQETEVAAKVLAELPFLVAGENVMSVMEEEVRASQGLR